jgi:hypothetical protein
VTLKYDDSPGLDVQRAAWVQHTIVIWGLKPRRIQSHYVVYAESGMDSDCMTGVAVRQAGRWQLSSAIDGWDVNF